MTLKEKFRMANMVDNGLTILEKYEKIADEFATGFADWIRVCKLKGRPYDFDNTKELLEIYKEEKDL